MAKHLSMLSSVSGRVRNAMLGNFLRKKRCRNIFVSIKYDWIESAKLDDFQVRDTQIRSSIRASRHARINVHRKIS